MEKLISYYNKFNEDKRLKSRHGQVEFHTTMAFIERYLSKFSSPRILDIGAGCGAYSIPLHNAGFDVTAVELVRYNLGIMKKNCPGINAFQGNAMKLKRLKNDSFDLTLLFGPMYHLYTFEDKCKALTEAKRVTRPGGVLMVAYTMNDYSILTYGFKEGHIRECMADGRIDAQFKIHGDEESLYDYVTLSDIDALNAAAGLTRERIFSPDGAADYMRQSLNDMDEETFALFLKYQEIICERPDLIGAGSHTVDVLRISK